jgi:hypothetical protein
MKTFLIIASTLFFSSLSGQTQPPSDSTGAASIITEPAGADVYIDSVFIGKSPLKGVILSRGSHRIRAFYPSVFAWNAIVMQESLTVSGADQQEKRLTLGEVLRVQSDPPGGIVHYGGAELGPTPLYTRLPSKIAGDLIVQKEGYDSLRVPAGEMNLGLLKVQLSPRNGSGISSRPSDVLGINGAIPRDHMMTYASGAAMIVSGVASAIMKDRANRNFDAYLQNNNAADLSATRRLDRGAAAALIVSQISFAFLAYFLLSE